MSNETSRTGTVTAMQPQSVSRGGQSRRGGRARGGQNKMLGGQTRESFDRTMYRQSESKSLELRTK